MELLVPKEEAKVQMQGGQAHEHSGWYRWEFSEIIKNKGLKREEPSDYQRIYQTLC
jgi:hypothetical protein